MAIEVIDRLVLSVDGVAVGCAQSVSWGASRERKTAVCQASGDTDESTPGRKSYSMSVEALMRVATGVDAAGQKTFVDIEELFEDGTIFEFEIGPEEVGATKKTGTAWVESYEQGSSIDDNATLNVTFAVTGPVTTSVNA